MTGLILTSEIKAVIGQSVPESVYCNLIVPIEEMLRRECFGPKLWDWLVSKLVDTDDVPEWKAGAGYNNGALVWHRGILYRADSAFPACEPPGDGWDKADKFSEACANAIWAYMVRIIANRIYHDALPQTFGRTGAGGLVIQTNDDRGQRGATMTELGLYQLTIMDSISRDLNNMDAYLEDLPTGCTAPKRPECESGHCGPETLQKRRVWRG